MFFSGKAREFVFICGRWRWQFVHTWWKRSSYMSPMHCILLAPQNFFSSKVCHMYTHQTLQNSRKFTIVYVASCGDLNGRLLSFDCKAKQTDIIMEDIIIAHSELQLDQCLIFVFGPAATLGQPWLCFNTAWSWVERQKCIGTVPVPHIITFYKYIPR